MGIWKSLFSSGDTLEKVTDAVISSGDKLVLTAEEKLDYNQRAREFFIKLAKAYEPFKIAQRILAIWFSFLFGLSFIIGLVATVFNMIVKYKGLIGGVPMDKIVTIDISPLIKLVSAFGIVGICITILAFYFSGGVVDSFRRKGE